MIRVRRPTRSEEVTDRMVLSAVTAPVTTPRDSTSVRLSAAPVGLVP